MEPEVRCDAAVFSPSTGIVEVHEYMACLQADLEFRGGAVVSLRRILKSRVRASTV
jgi:L-2-hydroxyglutarate oxidase LhgO